MKLTDREWFSLMAGLIAGKHIKTGRNSNVSNSISTNKKPIRVPSKATIGITVGSKLGYSRVGGTVKIPIMCTGVNIGVSAFVVKIRWDDGIVYNSVEYGDFGSNISIDTSNVSNRELLVLGQNDENMPLEDFVLFYVNFDIYLVPPEVNRVYIKPVFSNGTSTTDCSLLTLSDGNLYYITPIVVNDGYIYFEEIYRPEPIDNSITLGGVDNFPIGSNIGYVGGGTVPYGGSSTATYNLRGYLGGAGGSGAWVIVKIYHDGVLVGADRVWVYKGNFNISRQIDIAKDEAGYGKITIEIEIENEEDDNTPYYILIPAGGFSIVLNTEVNKDDNTFPKAPKIVKYIDNIEILDVYGMDLETFEPPEDIDIDAIIDEIMINDININEIKEIKRGSNDGVIEISLGDINLNEIISINKGERDNLENIRLEDININEIEGINRVEKENKDNLEIIDIYQLDTITLSEYTISGTVSDSENASIEGLGVYIEGEIVILRANVNSGYRVKGWYVNGVYVGKGYTIEIIVDSDKEVYLEIEEADYKIDYITDGLVLYVDGIFNTRHGHDENSTIWHNLLGYDKEYNLDDLGYIADGLIAQYDGIDKETTDTNLIWNNRKGDD